MTSIQRETGQEPGLTEKASASVQDAASTAQEKVGELKERGQLRLADQLDERSTRVGSQARTMAHAIRQSSEQLRNDGNDLPAQMAEQAAARIDRLGSYLEDKGGSDMLRDVEEFARRRPWFVAGIGLVAGLAASRFMKAPSERRYQPSGSLHDGRVSHRGVENSSAHGYSDPATAPISRELQSGEQRRG
jgi:ElaB/YqjD/DUF883 family membrane-anchored ribosome-binding protein